jgi:hypothetical protein
VTDHRILRIAAVAAVAGAVAQLVATALEPDWGGDPGSAIRVVEASGFWTGDRLLDLVGVFLTVFALTIVGRTIGDGVGREWARAGQPFLLLMGALGASAIAVGAIMEDLADAWTDGGPAARPSYLASFDAAARATEDLFFCAFVALGLYLATLAVAILVGRLHARWLGWAVAASAVLILTGTLLELVVDAAFVAVLVGFVLFMLVLIALGVSMWRHSDALVQSHRDLRHYEVAR